MKPLLTPLLILLIGWVVSGCDSSSSGSDGSPTQSVYDVYSYPTYTLTEDMKYSLAYMWHEEKLARDIYLALNEKYANSKMAMIASNGEETHITLVQSLVKKYDLNITNLSDYEVSYTEAELNALGSGEFAVPEIQSLYDDLYARGSASAEAALKVGCMVEVTDINDLTLYISQAGETEDLADVFTYLRSGSYKHYWAFDAELTALGVAEGCCSIGTVGGVDYCHDEYPPY